MNYKWGQIWTNHCSSWWGFRKILYSLWPLVLTLMLIPLTLLVCIIILLGWWKSPARIGYGLALRVLGLLGSCTSLETIQLVLTQVTGVATCRIQQLDHWEMLIEFLLDASMGQLHRDMINIDWWLEMGCKIDCGIPDQDQLDIWRVKPQAPPTADAKWANPLVKTYLAPVEPVRQLQHLHDEWDAGQQVASGWPVHWPIHTPLYLWWWVWIRICRIWPMFRPTSCFSLNITVNSIGGAQAHTPFSTNSAGKLPMQNWRYHLTRGFSRWGVSTKVTVRQSCGRPITCSLRGTAANLVWYMGPGASIAEILDKLMTIYGMVASFNVLMQLFYGLQQEKGECVTSFLTRIEGTMSHMNSKYPNRISEGRHHEAPLAATVVWTS